MALKRSRKPAKEIKLGDIILADNPNHPDSPMVWDRVTEIHTGRTLRQADSNGVMVDKPLIDFITKSCATATTYTWGTVRVLVSSPVSVR